MTRRTPTHDPITVFLIGFMIAAFVVCGLIILGVLPTGRAG